MRVNAGKAAEACQILDLDMEGLTEKHVTTAYRTASKACHPDSGNHNPERWAKIVWAKETLTRWIEAKAAVHEHGRIKGDCRACAGIGFIQHRTGFTMGPRLMCVMCEGSGNVKRKDRDQ